MEASARLYTLNYNEVKTYMWTAFFVACNLVLPQVFHLIPQGGIIFAPLSLVILAGAYKFGWRVGLECSARYDIQVGSAGLDSRIHGTALQESDVATAD